MASVTAILTKSIPMCCYIVDVEGLVNGANAITLSNTPGTLPALTFPPDGQWTPTEVWPFPYNVGAAGAPVSVDYSTIANSSGTITFTAYASGSTNARLILF